LLGFQTTPIYGTIEDSVDPVTSLPLTWKCYYSDLPFLAFWYKFTAFHLRNFASVEMFVDDCRAGTLPSVSVIDPPFTIADDHPPHDPQLGEKFIGLIVDALTTSQSWENSALVILYDESGGFYDHVAPPAAPEIDPVDTPLGFRVPAVIVSPYSKKRASHTVFDHTSVLRSIADRWNIAFGSEFGTRWKFANPIWGEFDFTTPAKPGGIYSGSPLADLDWAKGVREQMSSPQGKFEGLLERIFVLPELKALDKRAEVFETLGRLEQKVITQKRMSLY
jgi:phospholipase C